VELENPEPGTVVTSLGMERKRLGRSFLSQHFDVLTELPIAMFDTPEGPQACPLVNLVLQYKILVESQERDRVGRFNNLRNKASHGSALPTILVHPISGPTDYPPVDINQGGIRRRDTWI
jgi:hypothetical protein